MSGQKCGKGVLGEKGIKGRAHMLVRYQEE